MSDMTTVSDTTYRWGRLGADDVQAWAELVNLLAQVDQTDEFLGPEDLAEELTQHGVDPALDTWAVRDRDTMIAFGQVRVAHTLDREDQVRIWLSGGVHPQHRGRGIGRRLMQESEDRGRLLAEQRHPGRAAFWRADGNLEGASVRPMLEHRGYEIVRYFNQMSRPIPGQAVSTVPDLGPGIRLVAPGQEHEEALRVAHNLAFRDHWGSAETAPEGWHDHWVSRSARMAVSCVALDDGGVPLAYTLCAEWVPRELYVNIVGTVPAARGRGLAQACLEHTIARAAESDDYDVIELHVDSASPTGATRLYERVGFGLDKTFAAYQRDAG